MFVLRNEYEGTVWDGNCSLAHHETYFKCCIFVCFGKEYDVCVYLLYLNGQSCHFPIKWRVVVCQNHLNCVCLRVWDCGWVSNKKRNVLGKAQDFQFVENAFTRMWKSTNAKNKCELKWPQCILNFLFNFFYSQMCGVIR